MIYSCWIREEYWSENLKDNSIVKKQYSKNTEIKANFIRQNNIKIYLKTEKNKLKMHWKFYIN